jgi:hypothetical protein
MTHWTLAAGAKVGIGTSSGIFVYGRGAISWLNEDLNINFGGPVTSSTTTVRGPAVRWSWTVVSPACHQDSRR